MLGVGAAENTIIVRVQVAKIVPAASSPLGHGVGLAFGTIGEIDPVFGTSEWRLAIEGDFGVGRVYGNPIINVTLPIFSFGRLDDLDNGEIEFGGELEIARVMTGDGHNCARAVANEDVVGDPDGNLLVVHRI